MVGLSSKWQHLCYLSTLRENRTNVNLIEKFKMSAIYVTSVY